MSSFRRFQSDQTGSIMPIFGLIFILLLAVVALGVDVSNAVAERNRLQNAADMAAVTTARGLLTGEIEINEAQTYAENAFQQTATDFGKNAKSIFGKMKLDTQASASRKEENGSTVFTVQISGNAELPASPLSFMFLIPKAERTPSRLVTLHSLQPKAKRSALSPWRWSWINPVRWAGTILPELSS